MLWVRTFLTELHAWQWIGILVARLAVGMLFFLSGRGKLFVPERREQMRQTLIEAHVPFPDLNAVLVSTVEFVCGFLLIVGALTPLACVMLGCLDDRRHCHECDQENRVTADDRLALGIFVSAGSALPRDPFVVVSIRSGLAQRRSPDSVSPSVLISSCGCSSQDPVELKLEA
jgi:DoxX-like protein